METYTELDESELVADHLALVERLVWEMAVGSAASVDRDGLRLVGRLALERAAQAWEPGTPVEFAQVAAVWIRTAIADELQAIEWMACTSRRGPGLKAEVRLARSIAMLPARLRVVAATYFLEHRSMDEVADELGLTHEQVARLRAQALVLLRDTLAEALESRRLGLARPA
ncbi:hypothetical protein [Nocardioides sp. SR21]|uniref:hypothetical protein n=1 Tax=Nocardioides sp. SR21 TaxID=2919501 RepID=UPI001FAA67AF|nr:hypothetical protein [Nocardioides sp. SR21]